MIWNHHYISRKQNILIVKVKKKLQIAEDSAPVLYAKLIYSEKSKQILSLFKSKGNKNVDPFDYLNQYCRVKVALIFEGLYLSNNVVSLQINVHEVYVKEIQQRKALKMKKMKISQEKIFYKKNKL